MEHARDITSIEKLDSLKGKLPSGKQSFAEDLINGKYGYRVRGFLSDNQWVWVGRLIEMAESPTPERKVAQVGNLDGLFKFFENAKASKLKFPKLHLNAGTAEDPIPVQLAVAGPKSKRAGWITITDGGPYMENKFYGWVSPEGNWEKGYKEFPELSKINRLLCALAADPKHIIESQGHLNGRCCFCNRKLTDEKSGNSVELGYGPTCSKKWGLPWGKKAVEAKKAACKDHEHS